MQLLRRLVAIVALTAVSCSSGAPNGPGLSPSLKPAATVTPVTPPAPAPYGTPQALAKAVDSYMSGYGSSWGEGYAPSGVLVVAKDGEPVVVRTYGKADRGKGTDFTIDTPLRVGSLTKQFTAAAVMKLVETKKVATTDSVRKWVGELPAAFQRVTLHHLLRQTSGIPSYTDDPAMNARSKEDIAVAEMVAWTGKQPLDFAPGERFAYSNTNYYLLGVVAERASGKPFASLLTEALLAPAGLKSTGVAVSGAALGYRRKRDGTLVPAGAVNDTWPFAAGALQASAADLVRWDRALAGDRVLSAASIGAIFEPGAKCPSCGSGGYGYGFIVVDVEGTPVTWHGGAIEGFSSFFARAPEKGIAVVFLSNLAQFDAKAAGWAVLKIALTGLGVPAVFEREVIAVDEAFAKSVEGDYVISKKSREELTTQLPRPVLESIEGIDLLFEDGALTSKPVGQGRFGLRRGAEGVLFNDELAVELLPDFGDPKKPWKQAKGLLLKQSGLVVEYVRGKLPPKKKKL